MLTVKNITDRVNLLLSRFGKVFSLDFLYLFKHGNWVALKFLIVSISGFLLSLSFTRFGTNELLGQYQLVLSIMAITSIFSVLGFNAAALEAVVLGRDAGVLRAARLIFTFSLLGVPAMISAGFYYMYSKHEILFGETLVLAGFLFPFFYALGAWNNYYEGKSLFKESSIRAIVLNVVLTTLLVFGIIFDLNVFWLIVIFLGGNIFFQGVYFFEIYRKIKDYRNEYLDSKFALLFSFQKFTSGLSSNFPPLVLSFFFGIELLAFYYIANYVINALSSFLGSLITLYLPALFRGEKLNHKSIILNNIFVGIALWVIFILFLQYLFIRIYGDGYHESLIMAYWLSALLFFMPLHTYLVSFFSTKKKNSLLVAVFCFANITGLIAVVFAKQFGFLSATVVYMYTIELITTLPLLLYYYTYTSRNQLLIKS